MHKSLKPASHFYALIYLVLCCQQTCNSVSNEIIIALVVVGIFLVVVGLAVYQNCKKTPPPQQVTISRRKRSKRKKEVISSASISMISPLDSIKWAKVQNQKFGQDCTVCLQEGNLILQCGHISHPHCLKQWLKRKNWCPLCHTLVKSQKVTIICEDCRQFGLKKSITQVLKLPLKQKNVSLWICNYCINKSVNTLLA